MNIASYFNQLAGTISGTQSEIVDTSGHQLLGLAMVPTGTITAGTITFSIGFVPGTVYPLYTDQNTRYSIAHPAGAGFALTATAVSVLQPYRFVRVETVGGVVQNGRVVLPAKAY